ncbi:Crp/Fnr family transcriptional regulator [Telluribacter sp. SYSU D00476]|uniref:Crp/Fnr family transcriptional regulator n=1 Tax=Telluribacter sp. SYSU D00476 TaxID=2811430 RepID=UPI001FF0F296|nr:Crp/Fnr family transcriptional regulator [Telluribacter sp. SYSU D00476]
MEKLRDVIIDKAGLTDEHCVQLTGFIRRIHLKKKEYLIRAGTTCSFIGWVEEGTLRSFIQKEGDEMNLDFYLEGSFVSAYTSFLTQTPTHGSIQALSDTTVYLISYADYHRLLKSSDSWHRLGKSISDQLFIRKCRREASLLMDSAPERYQSLLQTYPNIEQLVAQYHIASYLGIKPESLSRIKSLTYING